MALIDALQQRAPVALPRFDKGRDDRLPLASWPRVERPINVLLFEGWCAGAQPQRDADLTMPINELERDQDPNGVWRRYVNAALGNSYARLFNRIGLLALIEAPGFDAVLGWRTEQERKLRARLAGAPDTRVMGDDEVVRFIAHYERLTRHILAEMPTRADILVKLDASRRAEFVRLGLHEAGGGQVRPAVV
jgi:D-glycerate 3-kinase